MRGWQLSDLDKLSARGMRVTVAPLPKERVVIGVKKIPSLNSLRDKAQAEFNTFIRNRDMYRGCISCQSGKVEQASHFFNAGQFTALRFNEDNVHGSCLQCNYFKHGNLLSYRENLIRRIGPERVQDLENLSVLNRVKHWSRTELEIIYKTYKELNGK